MSERDDRFEPEQVRGMFDRIAPYYDAMNTLMTAGIDGRWRRRTLDGARIGSGDRVLDVATGTGKLALAAAERVGAAGAVVGVDFATRMLDRARAAEARSTRAADVAAVTWLTADAMSLPFEAASFDAVTIGFGLRNLPDLDRGLQEMARVLRPGGRLAVLEIAEPRSPLSRWLFVTWFRRIIPVLGRLIGRGSAYAYLPASLERYPPPSRVAELMGAAGLVQVRWTWLQTGLATLHTGMRPDEGGDA